MEIGLTHTSTLVVGEAHTAAFVGSGDMAVLATPVMAALMENAAMLAVADALPEGDTTVGGHIETSHLKPTGVGAAVSATATLVSVEGRKLRFKIEAFQGETLIGNGFHTRIIVNRRRFLEKLG